MFNAGFTPLKIPSTPISHKTSRKVRFAAKSQKGKPDSDSLELASQPDSESTSIKTKMSQWYKRNIVPIALISGVSTVGTIGMVATGVPLPVTIISHVIDEALLVTIKTIASATTVVECWKKWQENKFDKTVPKDKINTTKNITITKPLFFRRPKMKSDKTED